ncbi:dGTPase [Marinicella sediminis]|uniref:Probable deoxyguanosinetriphosphate triphosphohydrolase n=1 Tax=Marinicella sediminis TaxID=1792834 RepID=A0ABV7JGG9_9GAMM|nr:dGTPase [Marinicella sediminis]
MTKPPINFKNKLIVQRPYDRQQKTVVDPKRIEYALESDRGRIINSASVRRLQQKTQVFPLERNAAVRSRLTHSLEVQQNGRYIVKTLFKKLGNQTHQLGLDELQPAVESLVEMACLMHDIGNPPFGHFGETAINEWFADHLDELFANLGEDNPDLKHQLIRDLRHFEGNAQAIRLTFSLQQMNLTYAQTACILKYTRPAYEPRPLANHPLSYVQKKPGYYLSEQAFVEEMLEQLNTVAGHRHPFAYVMEAADDIAYCLADLEDAVEKGILPLEHLVKVLGEQFVVSGGDPEAVNILSFNGQRNSFNAVLDMALTAGQRDTINHNHEFFLKLRINLIHHLVDHAAAQFIRHLPEVYQGSHNRALLEDDSVAHAIVNTFKQVGFRHVFNHHEVQTLELQGHRIITGLLDLYGRLMKPGAQAFAALVAGRKSGFNYEALLLNRIDQKIIKAYQHSVAGLTDDEALWERYHRCRLLQDHLSAMTDHSAHDEYRLLTVSA